MYENFRLFFSILWLVASGCLLASIFIVIVTWGGHVDFLYTSAIAWVVATIGAIVTSL